MQFELSTGYKIWITKLGKNKKYSLLVSTEPNSNSFTKVGLIDDMISLKKLYTAFTIESEGRMIEDLLNKIPLTITKFIEMDCPYCHNKHEKRIEYNFKINLLNIDNKKRYQMYYETSQIFSGTNEKYIGRATGTGYLTLEDAFNELQAIIKEQTNEK